MKNQNELNLAKDVKNSKITTQTYLLYIGSEKKENKRFSILTVQRRWQDTGN